MFTHSEFEQHCPQNRFYVIERTRILFPSFEKFQKDIDWVLLGINPHRIDEWSSDDWASLGDMLDEMITVIDDAHIHKFEMEEAEREHSRFLIESNV